MEYTLASPKWDGEIRLKYHPNGFLAMATLPEVMNVDAAKHMAGIFPIHVSILRWFSENTSVKITEVAADTSFDAFWEKFNKKSGSKIKAQQYWDGQKATLNRRPVGEGDRQDIMRMLPKYLHKFQGAKKDFQPLATTFLHERMWESELENSRENKIDLLKLIEERRNRNASDNTTSNASH